MSELLQKLLKPRFCEWFRINIRNPPRWGCKVCHTMSKDKICPLDKMEPAHD